MQGPLLLREARQRAGLSQQSLAARIGTTQSAVARWESGGVSPRLDTLERILEACGFEPRVSLRPLSVADRDQIRQRLSWSPRRRLDYLKSMLAFEERARRPKEAANRPKDLQALPTLRTLRLETERGRGKRPPRR